MRKSHINLLQKCEEPQMENTLNKPISLEFKIYFKVFVYTLLITIFNIKNKMAVSFTFIVEFKQIH